MNTNDRIAILTMGEILCEHLQRQEDPQDPGLLLSDRLRGALDMLAEGGGNDAAPGGDVPG